MEQDLVHWLIERMPRDPRLEVPPGDDAAVLRPPAMRRTVITVDMLTEGIDFLFSSRNGIPAATARQVGRKAIAVSLSDLAAMAARPEAVVIAVCLPRHDGEAIARELQAGIEEVAHGLGVCLAGGDTNAWDGPLVISVTAVGSVPPAAAWRRDSARPGDLLVVTGPLGGSLLGRHLAVEPRCREAEVIASAFSVHAAIDISDGLALDATRLLKASRCGALIDLAAIPIHEDARRQAAMLDGRSPLDHALGDGEDFELVLAMPAEAAHALVRTDPATLFGAGTTCRPTIIGMVTAATDILAQHPDGDHTPLAPRGFEHAFEGTR